MESHLIQFHDMMTADIANKSKLFGIYHVILILPGFCTKTQRLGGSKWLKFFHYENLQRFILMGLVLSFAENNKLIKITHWKY